MLLVAREYLSMMIGAVESGEAGSRPVIDRLEEALEIVSTREAAACTTRYGVDFTSLWPRELLEAAKDPRLGNFVKHRLPSS